MITNKKSNAKKKLIYPALNFLLLLAAAGGGCSSDKNAFENQNLLPSKPAEEIIMRINLGRISLTIPRGFVDENIYAFINEKTREKVEVWRGHYSREAKDFPAVVKEYRERINGPIPGMSSTIVKEGETSVAGLPAYEFIVETKHEKNVDFTRLILVRDSSDSYIELTLETADKNPLTDEEFVHVVKSAALTKNEQDGRAGTQTPENFSRHYAGALMLDVPVRLTRPNIFEFKRKNPAPAAAGTARLSLKLFEERPAESLEEAVKRESVVSDAAMNDSREIDTGEYKGKVQRYTKTVEELGMPPRQSPLMMAELEMTNGTIVRLQGQSPMPLANDMKTGFDELLSSVRSQKGN